MPADASRVPVLMLIGIACVTCPSLASSRRTQISRAWVTPTGAGVRRAHLHHRQSEGGLVPQNKTR